MPAHWLIKSEPDTYSFADLQRDGRTVWDGVRNHQAKRWLEEMKVGDEALFYHSGKAPEVVGIARIARQAFPDPSDKEGRFVAVEVTPVRALRTAVPLASLKAEPRLAELRTLRQGRISVTPVTDAEWALILQMGS
ncbi:MAG TPA: EVE domain-containing protein [Caulobacteraceae bacterium]|nr:EVE domain-containing protein [Caulobacteraceae bacterium]